MKILCLFFGGGAHLLKIYKGLGHKEWKFEKFYIRAVKTRGHWINTGGAAFNFLSMPLVFPHHTVF